MSFLPQDVFCTSLFNSSTVYVRCEQQPESVNTAQHKAWTVRGFIEPGSRETPVNQICVNMPLSLSALRLHLLLHPSSRSIFLSPLLFTKKKSHCPPERRGRPDGCWGTSWPTEQLDKKKKHPSNCMRESVRLSHAITFLWINLFMSRVKAGFSSTARLIMNVQHFNQ